MDNVVEYKDLKNNYVLVDVRSPGEFAESHIPGAVNIPLLNNEERAEVGTIYKQESPEKAKKVGIGMVSKSLPWMYEEYLKLKEKYDSIIIYCARGGMRSGSIANLLSSLKFNVYKLKDGYKGYRNLVLDELPKIASEISFVMFHGNTGVGKTDILHKLEEKGYDVLDLEGMANHRGSILGRVGLGAQPSQKQFEALIYEKLQRRKSNIVFIEAESKRIGTVIIPECIALGMQNAKNILVEANINVRAQRIIDEYVKLPTAKEEIIEAIEMLGKYIGKENADAMIQRVKDEKYLEVTKELMISHYDPTYGHGQKKYKYDFTVNADDLDAAVEQIISNL